MKNIISKIRLNFILSNSYLWSLYIKIDVINTRIKQNEFKVRLIMDWILLKIKASSSNGIINKIINDNVFIILKHINPSLK